MSQVYDSNSQKPGSYVPGMQLNMNNLTKFDENLVTSQKSPRISEKYLGDEYFSIDNRSL